MENRKKGDQFYGLVHKGKDGRPISRVTTATPENPFPNLMLGRKCDRRTALVEGHVIIGKGYLFEVVKSLHRSVVVKPVEGPFWAATCPGFTSWALEGKLFERQYYPDVVAHCLYVAKAQQSAPSVSGIIFLSSLIKMTKDDLVIESLLRFAEEYGKKGDGARDYAHRQVEKVAAKEIQWRGQFIDLSAEQVDNLLRILD